MGSLKIEPRGGDGRDHTEHLGLLGPGGHVLAQNLRGSLLHVISMVDCTFLPIEVVWAGWLQYVKNKYS